MRDLNSIASPKVKKCAKRRKKRDWGALWRFLGKCFVETPRMLMAWCLPRYRRVNQIVRKRDWAGICRRFLLVSGYLLLLVVAGVCCYNGARQLRNSRFFRVENIVVENQQRVSKEDILEAAELVPGMGLFNVDTRQTSFRIKRIKWIKTATVERSLPLRRVRIHVTEREPVAIVKLDHFYYVDDEGVLFKMLESGDKLDFPVISGIDREHFVNEPENSREFLMTALQLLGELKKRQVFNLDKVSEIHFNRQGDLYLFTMEGGISIRMGTEHFSRKLDHLERVYGEVQQNVTKLKGIDLNVENQVVVKLNTSQGD